MDNWELSTPNLKGDQDVRLQEKIKSNILTYADVIDKLNYMYLVFRDSKTTHTDIAHKMGVPTSHIVYLFKYHPKFHFQNIE